MLSTGGTGFPACHLLIRLRENRQAGKPVPLADHSALAPLSSTTAVPTFMPDIHRSARPATLPESRRQIPSERLLATGLVSLAACPAARANRFVLIPRLGSG